MAHPRTYSQSDPHLDEVRRLCLELPETTEVEAWGRPTFRVAKDKKMFAVFTYRDDTYRLAFKPAPDERPPLLADERFTIPKYLGPRGWLAIDLDNATDWKEVRELVHASYLLTAPKRLHASALSLKN